MNENGIGQPPLPTSMTEIFDEHFVDRSVNQNAGELWTSKLLREGEIFGGGLISGFGQGAGEAMHDGWNTAGSLAVSMAVGVGLTLAQRRAGVLKLGAEIVGANLGLGMLKNVIGSDRWAEVHSIWTDTWNNKDHAAINLDRASSAVGRLGFDSTVMIGGGIMGAGLGAGLRARFGVPGTGRLQLRDITETARGNKPHIDNSDAAMHAEPQVLRVADARPQFLHQIEGPNLSFADLQAEMTRLGIHATDLYSSIKAENLMGKGMFSQVYRLDKLDNYALRMDRVAPLRVLADTIEPVPDKLPGMNFGQPVARLGSVDVLKRQYGEPSFIPAPDFASAAEISQLNETRLRMKAELPQAAYDDFAAMIAELNSRGLEFDSNPKNLLIDLTKRRFGIVDVGDSPYKPATLNKMVSALENALLEDPTDGGRLADVYRQILLKSYHGARRAGLPVQDPWGVYRDNGLGHLIPAES